MVPRMSDVFNEGDDVLLYLDAKRRYLVKVTKGREFHTHRGFINLDDLVGKRSGERTVSSLGVEFVALKPTVVDYILKFPRLTQIMYPKDIGLLLMYTGIGPGSRVVEAGVGSGALTTVLAYHVKPSGRIYGYEVEERFLENARKNLMRAYVIEYVELKHKDITTGIDETDVDAVALDLATPWTIVSHAYAALKGGGVFASFSPTVNQVERTVEALNVEGFIDVETIECITRNLKVKSGETRPVTVMIGHTGYLIFARKAWKR